MLRFTKAFIPARGVWSSPFARWQGALAGVNSLDLAVDVTRRAFAERGVDPAAIGKLVLGIIFPTTAEALSRLTPVNEGGAITFGMQTHPADGAAGMIVTSEARARRLGGGEGVVQILASGTARVEKAHMPKAPVPAAHKALAAAGLTIADVNAVTTHNPFAVNDIYFSRQMGITVETMNEHGSSLVWGHPQGPTGLRAIAELVETLRLRGGGIGLFTGCAAGDTAAAIVLKVRD